VLVNPTQITGWVNGNLYLPTKERLGILPIPSDVRHSSGMAEFNIATIDKKQPHLYLARMQGTRKAILPVHTPAEHNLFRDLMKSNPVFNTQSSGPMWKLAVKVWNEFADTSKESDIFYKVCLLILDCSNCAHFFNHEHASSLNNSKSITLRGRYKSTSNKPSQCRRPRVIRF
jgi:hypothetical protein